MSDRPSLGMEALHSLDVDLKECASEPRVRALLQRFHDALDARTAAAIVCRETHELVSHEWGKDLPDSELFRRLRAPRTDGLTTRAVLKRIKDADAAYAQADADLRAVFAAAVAFLKSENRS